MTLERNGQVAVFGKLCSTSKLFGKPSVGKLMCFVFLFLGGSFLLSTHQRNAYVLPTDDPVPPNPPKPKPHPNPNQPGSSGKTPYPVGVLCISESMVVQVFEKIFLVWN